MPKKKVPAPSGLKMRPDGRYQRTVLIGKKRHTFYGRTEDEIFEKIINYKEKEEKGKTFEEVADEWEVTAERDLAYTTYARYRSCITRAVERFGDEYIKQIDVVDINNYIMLFAAQGYAQKTVKAQLSVINLICKYAVLHGYIKTNPCQYVTIPKNLPKHRRELPPDDQITLVKNSINCTFGLFAYFLLYTGLRRGEALALTYGDIDRKNRVIHVTKSLYHMSNKPCIKEPKTESGKRDVILLDALYKVLPAGKRDDVIFCDDNGDYLTAGHANSLWKIYCRESGVNITPHQLRHAFATILFNAGIPDKDAQELLGHSDIILTRNIYTHISNSRRKISSQQLNDYVNKCQNI